jgi:hypothetical protein
MANLETMVRMYLFYSNECGYCNLFTRKDGPWVQLVELVNPAKVVVRDINVSATDEESKHLKKAYLDTKQGVPQLVIVLPEGEVKRSVGYTEQIERIVRMIPTDCLLANVKESNEAKGTYSTQGTSLEVLRGSSRRRKSVRRSGRRPARPSRKAPRRASTRVASAKAAAAMLPAKRCFSPKAAPSIEAVLQHVLNHCNHKACKEKPSAAIACGRKCGCIA